jgi:hypothetical protein
MYFVEHILPIRLLLSYLSGAGVRSLGESVRNLSDEEIFVACVVSRFLSGGVVQRWEEIIIHSCFILVTVSFFFGAWNSSSTQLSLKCLCRNGKVESGAPFSDLLEEHPYLE